MQNFEALAQYLPFQAQDFPDDPRILETGRNPRPKLIDKDTGTVTDTNADTDTNIATDTYEGR